MPGKQQVGYDVTDNRYSRVFHDRSTGQSRIASLTESFANIVVGYGVAVASQAVMFPWFGINVSIGDNLLMGLVFTAVSLVRSYSLRRLFERFRGVKIWRM